MSICTYVHIPYILVFYFNDNACAKNLCANFLSLVVCVPVATCACRSSRSRGVWVAFFFGKALLKLQLGSIFQLTIARIMPLDRSDIDQRKEIRLWRRQESER